MPAGESDLAVILLGLAVILIAAKLGGTLFEHFKQSAVLGELLIGVLLGNLHHLGLVELSFLREQPVLDILAELGIILLLFEVGIEWTVPQMLRVGWAALLVAVTGMLLPGLLGLGTAKLFFAAESTYAQLFVGAILCATSVGITARVLRDLGKTSSPEAKLILGAAVIDDVLGLIVLATVSALIMGVESGTAVGLPQILTIVAKALLFLAGAILAGRWLAPRMFKVATRLGVRGILLPLSLSFCFLLAYLSHLAGLAPLVGAFTAGLILDAVEFEDLAVRERRSLEELLHPVTSLLLPVFFLLMGLKVDLRVFAEPGVLGFAAALTVAAIVGKLACAAVVTARGTDRLAVAIGMVPRGEVGLIFAGIGLTLSLGGRPVVSPAAYSGVVIMVLATTLLTPPLLKWRFGRITR